MGRRRGMILALLLAGCPAEKPGGDSSDSTITADDSGPVDADGDGFAAGDDCDDTERTINPLAPETCNELDDDCDGAVDEDATDQGTWYADADDDGYGDPDVVVHGCTQPERTSAIPGDCDDHDPGAYPAAPDAVDDGIDQDCDGADG
jgi:hypothetical protein